jgi:uncharacterized cofD-like protein
MVGGEAGGRRLRVVGLGGGHGLSVLLAGLARYAERRAHAPHPRLEISGIVSVADDGGSTGRLRQELGIPAVGDLRNCLVAMSRGDAIWNELLQHRFTDGEALGGHALGNLVMAALMERSGGLLPAVERLTRTLRLRGRVLPVTEQGVHLKAELEGGRVIHGESKIPAARARIARIRLCPSRPRPTRGVLEALAAADAIVIGPGSLYTSLVPNLLVDGVAEAIRSSNALRIFVCNLMTEPGETDGFDAVDHLRVIEQYLGAGTIDVCLGNSQPPRAAALARYVDAGAETVDWVARRITAAGVLPVAVDLLAADPTSARHDPARLAGSVVALARRLRRQPRRPLPSDLPPALLRPARPAAEPRTHWTASPRTRARSERKLYAGAV